MSDPSSNNPIVAEGPKEKNARVSAVEGCERRPHSRRAIPAAADRYDRGASARWASPATTFHRRLAIGPSRIEIERRRCVPQ